MKLALLAAFVLLLALMTQTAFASDFLSPEEAAKRVAAGTAVLIDVREPDEWQAGVAEPALLLPLSDLKSERKLWSEPLKTHQGKELILYCRSGNRSGQAAQVLAKEGFKVANAGAFTTWEKSGLPTRTPKTQDKN